MNERGLVEVPENAVRDEPVAFGLTGVQLGICGLAVLVAAALNLLPVWEPIRLLLIVFGAGPVALAAALPVGGEPAYRWLIRAVRYLRGPRLWEAHLISPGRVPASISEVAEKREQSGDGEDEAVGRPTTAGTSFDGLPGRPLTVQHKSGPDDGDDAPGARGRRAMGQPVRLRLVRAEEGASNVPPPTAGREDAEAAAQVPHLLPGLRIAAFVSFAGGVGKTTLAVEVATFVAARARYRTLEGDERPLRVLLLDASRVTAGAAGIRFGLGGEAISAASAPARWRAPRAVEDLAVHTRAGVDVALAPAHPTTLGPELQPEPERELFHANHVEDFLEGTREAGYQLLVADLGSHLEDGHRHLIDRADLMLGIVRPTLESLPDVHRLATVLRAMGAGRKLSLVANMAADDGPVRRHAHEYEVPVAGSVLPSPAFVAACERGEPAWAIDPALEPAIRAVAAAVWPLLADGAGAARGGRFLSSARRLALLGRGSQR